MQRLFQSSRFVQRSTLAASSRLPGSFLSLSSCRVHNRFLSTQFPPIAIPNHPISEKLQQRTQAAISQTPEEIWKQKSKKALEDAISSPPADPYAGINACILHPIVFTNDPNVRAERYQQECHQLGCHFQAPRPNPAAQQSSTATSFDRAARKEGIQASQVE
jgi:hypothetical protein